MFYQKNDNQVAVFVAPENFRDEEYFDTISVLQKEGLKVVTISTKLGMCRGKMGASIISDMKVDRVRNDDFCAFVFIGGSGSAVYKGEKRINRILKEAFYTGKVVGAICIAPMILYEGGFLRGRKFTVWNEDGEQEKIFSNDDEDVTFLDEDVVVDRNLVTANGPKAAREFASEIVDALHVARERESI